LHAYIQRRIEKLEEIGFEWNDSPGDQQVARLEPQQSLSSKPQGLDWEDFYALLPAYKAKYNTLAIPVKYETPEGVRIGAWATRQRSFYNRTLRGEKSMSKKRIAKLNAIDFPWGQKKKFGCQDYYQLVLDFKAEYHHFVFRVAMNWARNQRALYANKLRMETSVQVAKDDSHSSTSQHPRIDLLNARFELLNSISFPWNRNIHDAASFE
jgi:Helicase associated domain